MAGSYLERKGDYILLVRKLMDGWVMHQHGETSQVSSIHLTIVIESVNIPSHGLKSSLHHGIYPSSPSPHLLLPLPSLPSSFTINNKPPLLEGTIGAGGLVVLMVTSLSSYKVEVGVMTRLRE